MLCGCDVQLFRLNWWQRKQESLPPHLLAYSLWDASASVFTLPNHSDAFKRYQVPGLAAPRHCAPLPNAGLLWVEVMEGVVRRGCGR